MSVEEYALTLPKSTFRTLHASQHTDKRGVPAMRAEIGTASIIIGSATLDEHPRRAEQPNYPNYRVVINQAFIRNRRKWPTP